MEIPIYEMTMAIESSGPNPQRPLDPTGDSRSNWRPPAPRLFVFISSSIEAMAACGCTLNNAYMQHSLLALPVIPELRISDLGLVDVTRFELTELFEKDSL